MKHLISILVTLAIVLALPGTAAAAPKLIPTFSIVSVDPGVSVTIRTYNFPAHDSFVVLMGYMHTRGVNGIKVTTISSGNGGSFTGTYDIPEDLKDEYQIAIRLQSNSGSGYFAYNWFYNKPGGGHGNPPPEHPGIPTFRITGVVEDTNVTIETRNFPKTDSFKVLMGLMGTKGVNGIHVTTVSSDGGGTLTFTFDIPTELKGKNRIAIRLESTSGSGYYAYNWFYNNTSGNSGGPGPIPGYYGYPTFSISSVVRNKTVTILTNNLPPNDQFKVLMGPMGTRGVNGYLVKTIDTGEGGAQTLTFDIPAELKGAYQISIRMQSTTGTGLYAYNWFYNNSTP
jgi:hypothetical protein